MAEKKTAKKAVAKKAPAKKTATKKAEAPAAPAAPVAEAPKAPAKKAPAKKAAAKAKFTAEQIYSMTETAAYFAAVNDNYSKEPFEYWKQAEKEIEAMIKA